MYDRERLDAQLERSLDRLRIRVRSDGALLKAPFPPRPPPPLHPPQIAANLETYDPNWETSPYLLVGAGALGTDTASFPEPSMARYGRVGAPGSPWWVMVKRSDKDAY